MGQDTIKPPQRSRFFAKVEKLTKFLLHLEQKTQRKTQKTPPQPVEKGLEAGVRCFGAYFVSSVSFVMSIW